MNYRMVFYIIGRIIGVVALLMVIPTVCAAIYHEPLLPFIIPIAISLAVSLLCTVKPPKNRDIRAKDGFISVALSWIVLSLIGCLPFIISGEIPRFIDAFFETVSGFTTTGSTVISDVESVSRGILLWRSLTQWLGGMGVLVFLLAILPKSDLKSSRFMHVMKAEVPGPTATKVVPRIADTARVMYGIYFALTALLFLFLLFGEMNVYEALCHALATGGTGGFGIMNDSIASYSAYSQYVISVFMLIFGINFNLFFLVLVGKLRSALRSTELWTYFGIVAAAVALIAFNIYSLYGNLSETLRHSTFQVATIITTTGYSTADFNLWPTFSKAILLMLMFVGGCAGSTAGGLKVSRILLLFKISARELKQVLHPRSVRMVKQDGKTVPESVLSGVTTYIAIYLLCLVAIFLLISLDKFGFETNFSATIACFNNIGPGFADVGPMFSYAEYSYFSKIVLSIAMLLGRLEIFPLILAFSPITWRKK